MAGYITEGAELLVWKDAAWLDEVRSWINEKLMEVGSPATGSSEQIQVRPWGTVLRTPTVHGDVFFKASVDKFEAPLTRAVAGWRPDCALPVLAVDVDRAWILLPDGGMRLRELSRAEQEPHWERVLARYAALQLDLGSRCEELLQLGLPDQRLKILPAQFEQLVDEDAFLSASGDGLTGAERRRLRALGPRLREMRAELDRFGIPSTLQHDELHDGHVYLRGDGYVFLDWAECVVSHPFITLRGMFLYFVDVFELPVDDPLLTHWRDVYLESWTAFGRHDDLVGAFRLIHPVGAACRALRWHGILERMAPAFKERYGDTVPKILRRFLDAAE